MERRRAVDARIARTARHRPTENQTDFDAVRALTRLESSETLFYPVTSQKDATRHVKTWMWMTIRETLRGVV